MSFTAPHSVLSRMTPGNAQTVQAFALAFKAASVKFVAAMKTVQPEFGAYMSYSLYQEVGTMKNHPPPRPHIIPAVNDNATVITTALTSYALNFLKAHIGKRVASATYVKVYEQAWMRVLNGPVRIDAVNKAKALGVWQYGFHVRSIAGYPRPRSSSEIQALQQEADAKRTTKIKGKK